MIDAANHARKAIKEDYLNHVMVYTDRLRRTRAEKINVVASIHDAIDKGEVEAYPQIQRFAFIYPSHLAISFKS